VALLVGVHYSQGADIRRRYLESPQNPQNGKIDGKNTGESGTPLVADISDAKKGTVPGLAKAC